MPKGEPLDAARQLEIARCLFRETNDALFVFDPADLRVLDVNPAALRLTGLDRREALALRLIDLVAAEDPRDFDRLVEANRRTTFFHSQEGYSLVRPGGRSIPVNVSVTRIHVEPTPLGLAVVRDVSERRRAQEVVDRFFRLSPALFAVFGAEGTFLRANPAWHDILGYTPEELNGTNAFDLIHPEDRAATRATEADTRAGNLRAFENRYLHRDGSYRRLSWNASMADGQIYAVAVDVTERERSREIERAKDAAEAAGRAKDKFLAVLSHELRTPLTPILLAVTAMLEGATPAEEFNAALEMIRRNVELEARLIDDLLDVTRIIQGKLALRPRLVDAHPLIGQALDICRGEIDAKGLQLETDLAAERSRVEADPGRLQQVFWNLIQNAVKFTPPGGSLVIRTRDEPSAARPWLVVEFNDSGLGIDPESIGRIFEPFQQGESSTTRRFGGLGLGLAICRGILDAHGGTLVAESAGRGLGSTFRVRFPAIGRPRPDATEAPRRDTSPAVAAGPYHRILLVEDEPETQKILARLIRALGHEVETANSVASASGAAAVGGFDLIISDLDLPDGSGLDLMQRVRTFGSMVPAIALTGFGTPEDIRSSREAGFIAHLTKPVGFKELSEAIRMVIS
jgi:PAS domain S-box-containing protein